MKFEYPAGATPLDPDEIVGLIPEHFTTQTELNEWEQANILEAEMWFSALHRFAYNNVPTAGNVIGGQNATPNITEFLDVTFLQQIKKNVSLNLNTVRNPTIKFSSIARR